MRFPLDDYVWPDEAGQFGAVRKFDIHTGVDLYCEPGAPVYSIGAGMVTAVEDFTGPKAGSPWWNDTQSILVYNSGMYGGTVCYGEVEANVRPGQMISPGQLIGHVKTVLKKDKGRPMTMLHFEQYEGWVSESVVWNLNEDKPDTLKDPTDLLDKLRNAGKYQMKDLLGQPIRVGDLVVNSVMQYRSANMRLGVVVEIETPKDPKGWRAFRRSVKVNRAGGNTGWTDPDCITVLRWDAIGEDHPSYKFLTGVRDSIL